MWQYDTRAKMCREIASTQEGRYEICRYEWDWICMGIISDIHLCRIIFGKNTRCEGTTSFNVEDNGIF